ncbi:hypothetical protein BaRGS_00036416 [Batillaria attramentaria]|uniref:Uncharacterized protein n=1 Tax=Batillaria attramentaria TaxID=370345 RepID=A0ABD0JBZ5_9CAEN
MSRRYGERRPSTSERDGSGQRNTTPHHKEELAEDRSSRNADHVRERGLWNMAGRRFHSPQEQPFPEEALDSEGQSNDTYGDRKIQHQRGQGTGRGRGRWPNGRGKFSGHTCSLDDISSGMRDIDALHGSVNELLNQFIHSRSNTPAEMSVDPGKETGHSERQRKSDKRSRIMDNRTRSTQEKGGMQENNWWNCQTRTQGGGLSSFDLRNRLKHREMGENDLRNRLREQEGGSHEDAGGC